MTGADSNTKPPVGPGYSGPKTGRMTEDEVLRLLKDASAVMDANPVPPPGYLAVPPWLAVAMEEQPPETSTDGVPPVDYRLISAACRDMLWPSEVTIPLQDTAARHDAIYALSAPPPRWYRLRCWWNRVRWRVSRPVTRLGLWLDPTMHYREDER